MYEVEGHSENAYVCLAVKKPRGAEIAEDFSFT